ncbi:hypothetical protein [Cupriavidus oxalaticus]|uniref:hypothetical protein n=1 Tax=Cupriavidus oxalaticus TaxID=96344 RepID=UPI0031749A91
MNMANRSMFLSSQKKKVHRQLSLGIYKGCIVKTRTRIALDEFPLRPKAKTDESVRMYIHRVYDANGHRVGVPFLQRPHLRLWFQAMGRLCGSAIHEAPFAWSDGFPRIPGRRLENRGLKYCCACASEFGYQLWIIDYYDFRFCPVHLQPLLRLCYACAKPVSPREVLNNHCDCGFDLKDTPVIGVRADFVTWELVVGQYLRGVIAKEKVSDNRLLLPLWVRKSNLPRFTTLMMEFYRIFSISPLFRIDDVTRDSLIDWPNNFRDNLLECASSHMDVGQFGVAAALRSLGHRCYSLKEDGIDAEIARQINLLILEAGAAELKSGGDAASIQRVNCSKNHISRRIDRPDLRRGRMEDHEWFENKSAETEESQ